MADKTLTKTRRLCEDRPLWADTPRIGVRSRHSPSARSYDVVVVGAGISGALMAEALARPGRSVAILDRRAPVHGSTMASTAMIQHEIDQPLHVLRGKIGRDAADRAWQRSAQAVVRLEAKVRSLGLSCRFERRKALYLAGDTLDAEGLEREVAARAEAGIAATFLDAAALGETYGLKRGGAILSDLSAAANPTQMTAGFLRAAASAGAEIVSGVEIADLEPVGEEVVLATTEGHLIRAGHVVFCTGYEFLKVLESRRHAIISTWALATEPGLALPSWLDDHLLWEASDPYLYLRTDRGGRLIAGGEDEEDPEAYLSDEKRRDKAKRIIAKVERLLGVKIGRPAYRWSAAFGATATGLPLLGAVLGMPRVRAVMGFGGNGITFSQIASEIVATAIEGSRDPDAELFSF